MKCWADLEVFGVGFFRGGAGDKSYERVVDSSVGVGGFGFDFVTIILNWSRRVYRPLRNGLGFYRFFGFYRVVVLGLTLPVNAVQNFAECGSETKTGNTET